MKIRYIVATIALITLVDLEASDVNASHYHVHHHVRTEKVAKVKNHHRKIYKKTRTKAYKKYKHNKHYRKGFKVMPTTCSVHIYKK